MNIANVSAEQLLVPPNIDERYHESSRDDLMDVGQFYEWWSTVEVEMDYFKGDVDNDVARCHIHYAEPHVAFNAITADGVLMTMSTAEYLGNADHLIDATAIFELADMADHGGHRELDNILADYRNITIGFRRGMVAAKVDGKVFSWS